MARSKCSTWPKRSSSHIRGLSPTHGSGRTEVKPGVHGAPAMSAACVSCLAETPPTAASDYAMARGGAAAVAAAAALDASGPSPSPRRAATDRTLGLTGHGSCALSVHACLASAVVRLVRVASCVREAAQPRAARYSFSLQRGFIVCELCCVLRRIGRSHVREPRSRPRRCYADAEIHRDTGYLPRGISAHTIRKMKIRESLRNRQSAGAGVSDRTARARATLPARRCSSACERHSQRGVDARRAPGALHAACAAARAAGRRPSAVARHGRRETVSPCVHLHLQT